MPRGPLTLHLERQIGGETGPEAYTFYQIGDIAVAATGDIYVLDRAARTVKVYDDAGRFRRSIGSEGAGPGEFVRPISVEVDSVVRVNDAAQRRVSSFTLSGDHRETRQLPSLPELNLVLTYDLQNDNVVGVSAARHALGHPTDNPTIAVVTFRRNHPSVDTLLVYHAGAVLWHPADRLMPWGIVPAGFGEGGAWATSGDSLVAVANGYSGRIQWYRVGPDGLQVTRTIELGLPSVPRTERDLGKMEREFRSARKDRLGRIAFEVPPQWSVASKALFADDGSLWLRANATSERGYIWSIVAPGERTEKRVRLPTGFDLHAVRDGRLYGVSKTENDVPVVQIYRWRR
jgi:hypothetical protein